EPSASRFSVRLGNWNTAGAPCWQPLWTQVKANDSLKGGRELGGCGVDYRRLSTAVRADECDPPAGGLRDALQSMQSFRAVGFIFGAPSHLATIFIQVARERRPVAGFRHFEQPIGGAFFPESMQKSSGAIRILQIETS